MIVGVDEVGRGCWAGPLVAAAVLLHGPVKGLKDSKLLNQRQRENLAAQVYQSGEVGLGWVSAQDIDAIGLTEATRRAMQTAVSQIRGTFDELIIDGSINYLADFSRVKAVKTLVKADASIPAVSAASIVAKVARDQYMRELAQKYPQYMFERHVGYGTKLHLEMIKLHGVCELHRLSYKPLQVFQA